MEVAQETPQAPETKIALLSKLLSLCLAYGAASASGLKKAAILTKREEGPSATAASTCSAEPAWDPYHHVAVLTPLAERKRRIRAEGCLSACTSSDALFTWMLSLGPTHKHMHVCVHAGEMARRSRVFRVSPGSSSDV